VPSNTVLYGQKGLRDSSLLSFKINFAFNFFKKSNVLDYLCRPIKKNETNKFI